ncbi:hypothetical protein BDV96DRAFT_639132 [Lophiotrema nucula]|uniref:Uncharacterized protein n=1 Tax=Lophiotrema nucula TaxID=690887 RepID=A0A6A5ZS50_9PLEO|nr:hypothetical protein BDV96DRAFT_639132 [Lophiotrema nucula]
MCTIHLQTYGTCGCANSIARNCPSMKAAIAEQQAQSRPPHHPQHQSQPPQQHHPQQETWEERERKWALEQALAATSLDAAQQCRFLTETRSEWQGDVCPYCRAVVSYDFEHDKGRERVEIKRDDGSWTVVK